MEGGPLPEISEINPFSLQAISDLSFIKNALFQIIWEDKGLINKTSGVVFLKMIVLEKLGFGFQEKPNFRFWSRLFLVQ